MCNYKGVLSIEMAKRITSYVCVHLCMGFPFFPFFSHLISLIVRLKTNGRQALLLLP